MAVYGQALLGLLAAAQEDNEALRSVYVNSVITTIAIAVSASVKLGEEIMSTYHLHIVICYLSILGGPMVLSALKLKEFSIVLQLGQFIWAIATLGISSYAIAIRDVTLTSLQNCNFSAQTSISEIQRLALAIDAMGIIFATAVLGHAILYFRINGQSTFLRDTNPRLASIFENPPEKLIQFLQSRLPHLAGRGKAL